MTIGSPSSSMRTKAGRYRGQALGLLGRVQGDQKHQAERRGQREKYGLPVFKSGTTQRVVYPTTASEGRTVLADFPDEIEVIKDELKEVLTNAEI